MKDTIISEGSSSPLIFSFSFSPASSSKKNGFSNGNVHLTWENQLEGEFTVPHCTFLPLFLFDPSKWIPPQTFSQTKWNSFPKQQDSQWINRIINGDSLLGMTTLWANGFSHQIQMIYFDPPFGIRFDAEFQVDETTTEGYQDTWQHGLASYMEYLRKRLVLCRELLTPSGSIFVQIGETNLHYVRCLLDEIFGSENFISQITFRTAISTNNIKGVADYLLWYAADKLLIKRKPLYGDRTEENIEKTFTYSEQDPKTGEISSFKPQELVNRLESRKKATSNRVYPFVFHGTQFFPPEGFEWKWDVVAMTRLAQLDRLAIINDKIYGKRYLDDFPDMILTNIWNDTSTSTFASRKQYIVKTNPKIICRCLAATTDRGDLILDPTSGSGTTAVVAEEMERRWIVFDTSPSATLLTSSWLLGSLFPSYKYSSDGQDFQFKEIPQISLSDLAHGRPTRKISRYDQPKVDTDESRITSPFTIQGIQIPPELYDLEKRWSEKLIKLIEANGILTPINQIVRLTQIKQIKIEKYTEFETYLAKIGEKICIILFYPPGILVENLPSHSSLAESIQSIYSNSELSNGLIVCGSYFSPTISYLTDPNFPVIFVTYHPDLLIQELAHTHHPEAFHIQGILDMSSDGILLEIGFIDPLTWEWKVIPELDWAIWGEAERSSTSNLLYFNITQLQMPFYEKFIAKRLISYMRNLQQQVLHKNRCIWGYNKRGFWYLSK